MAIISIITKSELDKAYRVDPDFYRLDYLMAMQTLTRVSSQKLSTICFITDGNHLKISSKFSDNEGVRYLRGQDISTEMLIDDRNQVFIPESAFDSLQRSHIFKGDVLITIVGANTGLIGLVFDPPAKLTANCKLGIVRSLAVNPEYLYAFLTSKYGQFQILRAKRGGGQTGLILPDMRNLLIARFTEKLENLISLVVNNGHQKIKKSKEIYQNAEKILLSELGLFDWQLKHTLTWVKQSSEIIKSQRVDAEHFQPKYEEIRECIRSYKYGYTRLIDIAPDSTEVIDPHTKLDFDYIELSNINQSIGIIDSPDRIKGKDAPSRARMLLRCGDILASTVEGSIDKVAIVSQEFDEAIGTTGFFVLRPRITENFYLLLLVKSLVVREQMLKLASGTILTAVSSKSIGSIIVPTLPKEQRKEIDDLVRDSHSARREAKALLEKAKRAVEIAIEESEEKAINFLEQP